VIGIERGHLEPRAEREAELGHDRRGHDPAAARRGRNRVALGIDRDTLRGVDASTGGCGEGAGLDRQRILLGDERPARGQAAEPGPQLERRLLGVDQRAALRGIVAREQRFDRHVREARVAIARVAVRERELRGLEPEMERVGARGILRGQIEALEQAQLLQKHRALSPGPGLPDARTAVVDRERVFDRARVARKIRRGDQPGVLLPARVAHRDAREVVDRLRTRAAIERVARGADPRLARPTRRALRKA
jgi:hypothetical protein